MIRTRFAPSPTGDLHVGGAWTALASWALARAEHGRVVLRVEDLDAPRLVTGSAERIASDLAWLGLDWDESPARGGPHAPYTQSERRGRYEDALSRLDERGLTYLCDCSRAEIARVASAPHEGEELVYPGTCRDLPRTRAMKRPPAVRLRVSEGTTVSFEDRALGSIVECVDLAVGDFVLRRGDGVFAYQLAVAVDDASMGITDVVRAVDLSRSTARQLWLMMLLGYATLPTYTHVPMVVDTGGGRLAKRNGATTIHDLREGGLSAPEIIGRLAHGLGLVEGREGPMTPREVAQDLTAPSRWRKTSFEVPTAWTLR